jgi:hypothetical protein
MRQTPKAIVDLASAIPDFAPLARTTVRLHPRRGECAPDQSKMGGTFLWPAGEPWPVCEEHGCVLTTVLQLRRDDAPELGFRGDADLFQLLWCPNDHENIDPYYAPASQVFWRKRADIQNALTSMPPLGVNEELYVPAPCVLHPERVAEYPDLFVITQSFPALRKKIRSSAELANAVKTIPGVNFNADQLYQYWLSVASGTKVGGHPEWIQDPEPPDCRCGRQMEYLLTIASDECDGGTWGRWCPEEERHVWTGNDYGARALAASPTELLLGDAGNLNYFVCRQCEGWPIASVFQCS